MLEGKQIFEGSHDLSPRETIRWWIARLPLFNLSLFVVGIITWLLVLIAGSNAVKPGEDFEEPFMMILGPPVYAVLANLCYFLGPLSDVLFRIGQRRVTLFKTGFVFSLILTALPGAWAVTAWLITIHTGKKLGT
ncbi:hypothetical protein FTO74_00970 [Granulicella sp. WH15]|uniref:hypothetical protein n=1 Tax=Granulicella sp. WH15 TaxID=2602070 RepID=UPI001366FB4A|nr:hypothetical protein [Granulicella sp. WH15]QHN02109.1 hypothetical protein FTO74_00970 [Granulicella sp. WH15]